MDEWVACSERLPELHQDDGLLRESAPVLALKGTDQSQVVLVLTTVREDLPHWEGDGTAVFLDLDDVTHWRPLPAPPLARDAAAEWPYLAETEGWSIGLSPEQAFRRRLADVIVRNEGNVAATCAAVEALLKERGFRAR